jgi:hypothetical protein
VDSRGAVFSCAAGGFRSRNPHLPGFDPALEKPALHLQVTEPDVPDKLNQDGDEAAQMMQIADFLNDAWQKP